MYLQKLNCPVAIAAESMGSDYDNETQLLRWCLGQLSEGEVLTVWVSQKSILSNNEFLSQFSQNPSIDIITSRGFLGMHRANGPVIAFYPSPNELSEFNDIQGMTALGVVSGSHPLNIWSHEIGAVCIGERLISDSDDGVDSPLSAQAKTILENTGKHLNHNNTITGHFEKSYVKKALESLRDGGFLPDPGAAVEWTAAAGWRHNNPKQIGEWVEKYQRGGSIRV